MDFFIVAYYFIYTFVGPTIKNEKK